MHLWSHVNIWADFNKLFNKKCMQRIVPSQQSINKSSSVTTQRRPLRKHYKGHRGDWIKQVFTKSNLTRVLSMTWTKYETGFPVQETARPWGFSSETCNIVPISRNQNRKDMKVQGVFEGLKMFPILKVIKVYDQGGLPRTFAQVWYGSKRKSKLREKLTHSVVFVVIFYRLGRTQTYS